MEDDKALKFHMLRALELARKGAGRVAPNPMVGAVVVKDNEVIGEGYHHAFGQAHAEVDALECCNRLGNDPIGATMYVTLEPCCHHGKTPPCTDAIMAAGITKVIVATIDDFEEVSGKGVEILQQNGITVDIGLCGEEARELNAGFFKLCREKKPFVILKWAQSIDGKLTFRDGDQRRWFTGDLARHHVHELRDYCDGIIVGSRTVLDDDPMLNVRIFGVENTILRRFVLDSRLSLPLDRKLFNSPESGPSYIFTSVQAMDERADHVAKLRDKGCEVLPVGVLADNRLDLNQVLNEIAALGVCNLMVEGGPTLLNELFVNNLADKVVVYTSPIVVGDGLGVVPIQFGKSFELENVKNEIIENDIVMSGKIVK